MAARANLDAELSRIDRAIDGLENTVRDLNGSPVPVSTGVPAAPAGTEPTSDAGPYAGVELTIAAFDVLDTFGDLGNTDLARKILAGGFKTKSDPRAFGETVRAVLRRDKAVGYGIRKGADGKWTVKPAPAE